jgi:hypothetical protein
VGTKFLALQGGVIVEIDDPDSDRVEMHAATAEQVDTTVEMVGSMLGRILQPIGDAFADLSQALNVPVAVSSAEVELGVSFSAEGNLFIAKSKGEATLKVKVSFRPLQVGSVPQPTTEDGH